MYAGPSSSGIGLPCVALIAILANLKPLKMILIVPKTYLKY